MTLYTPHVFDNYGREIVLDALRIHEAYLVGWEQTFQKEIESGNAEAHGALRKTQCALQELRQVEKEISNLKPMEKHG